MGAVVNFADATGKQLEQVSTLLATSGLSDSSIRHYKAAWRQFLQWYGKPLERLPGTEVDCIVADYALHLHDLGKAPRTVYLQVAGLKWIVAELYGIIGPWRVWLKRWKGIQREGRGRGRGQKDGLTWEQAEHLAAIAPDARKGLCGVRDAGLILVMADGLLRASEAVAVDVEHIQRQDDGSARLLIPASKTDQSGKGAYVYVSAAALQAVDYWLKLADISTGPVFIGIGGPGKHTRNRLKAIHINTSVKLLCEAAGYRGNYGSHSFRIGGAQELAKRGATDIQLMHAGRWRSAEMAAHYARPQRTDAGPMAKLRYGKDDD